MPVEAIFSRRPFAPMSAQLYPVMTESGRAGRAGQVREIAAAPIARERLQGR